jgi:hypothetical protein
MINWPATHVLLSIVWPGICVPDRSRKREEPPPQPVEEGTIGNYMNEDGGIGDGAIWDQVIEDDMDN